MKKRTTLFLVAVTLFSVLPVSAATGSQYDFNNFWARFRSAVRAKDKAAVAAMTKFPLSMPYGMGSVKTRAQLSARYDKIFNGEADAVKCFASERPQAETGSRYSVACGFKAELTGGNGGGDKPIVYTFERTRTGWKFVSFDNINE